MSRGPTPQQKRAIESLDRDVFCEAGAGTGKTSVLVQRCIETIVEDGVDTSEILAITFTKRAAEELRERLRAGLEAAAEKASDDSEQDRLRGLARDTEKAWFSTIHSFCRRLLASEPVAAGIDPGFRVAEDGEADRLKKRAFSAALARLAEQDRERAAGVIAVCDASKLRPIILDFHGALRSRGIANPTLPDQPKGDAGSLGEVWRFICDLMEKFNGEYESLKRRRVVLDFEDLELRARALLEDDEIRKTYQERFAHILVDEFQDTNRLQLDVIDLICGDRGQVTRFAVGDELQSIYRFRHADIDLFRSEGDRADGRPDTSAEKMPLSGNFRSHAEVLASVNCFGSVLIGEAPEHRYGKFAPLDVGSESQLSNDLGEPRVEMLLTSDRNADWAKNGLPGADETRNDKFVAEARLLAKRLAELKETEPPEAKFVVLLRKMKRVEIFRAALEEFGLDPHVIGGKTFWEGQQVGDVLALLRLIANPLDDEALLQGLASPAGGVSPDGLWALAQGRGNRPLFSELRAFAIEGGTEGDEDREGSDWTEWLNDNDRESLRRFGSGLDRLRTRSSGLGLSELIDAACQELGYDLATLMMHRGQERWASVRKLQRKAAEFESREGSDLRAFLEYAEDEKSRESEGDPPAADEATGGVTVMTIHSAKGLEFDVVAVAGLGDQIKVHNSTARIGFESDSNEPRVGLQLKGEHGRSETCFEMEDLTREEELAMKAEERRIFHVGVTRARSRLLLSGVYKSGPKGSAQTNAKGKREEPSTTAGLIEHLIYGLKLDQPAKSDSGTLEIDPAPVLEGLEQPGDSVRVALSWNLPDDDVESRLASPESSGTPNQNETPAVPVATPDRPPVSQANRFSFSSLSTFERCGYRFYAERELGLRRFEPTGLASSEEAAETPADDPTRDPASGEVIKGDEYPGPDADPSARALRYGPGNAVHRLLEWSAGASWAVPPEDLVVKSIQAESLETDLERIERVSGLVSNWLESKTLARLRDASLEFLPEVEFVLPVGDSMINGSIDLLALPAVKGDAVEVVDYKTNSIKGSSPEEKMKAYRTQRDIYALAVAHLAGEVRTSYVFLEDPSDPQELVYDSKELDGARERIEELLSEVASGEFPVTRTPNRALCFDCPAFRLCPWPREARDRDGKEAEVELELDQITLRPDASEMPSR